MLVPDANKPIPDAVLAKSREPQAQPVAIHAIEAWQRWMQGDALFIDVRHGEERLGGKVIPDALHIPFRLGATLVLNPDFIAELTHLLTYDRGIIMVCNSGWRSQEAATQALAAGFRRVYYICDGLNGEGFPR